MILPTKHITFSQSLLGFGAYLLSNLETSKSVDALWEQYLTDYDHHAYPAKHKFDNLVQTLIFLYSTGSIIENDGVVEKCN